MAAEFEALIDAVADRVADRVLARLAPTRPAERLSLADAARSAGVTARVLRAAVRRGELSGVKVGRGFVVARTDLETWLASHRVERRPEPQPAPSDARAEAKRAIDAGLRSGRLRAISGGRSR